MSEILTDEARGAIRARAEAATAGPWVVTALLDDDETPVFYSADPARYGESLFKADWGTKEDAEFCAHARTDVPALMADGDALREQVARLTEDNEGLRLDRDQRLQTANDAITRLHAAEQQRDTERAARLAAEAKLVEWLDERGFYELMQRYRYAKDAGISPAPAEAFEDVKAAILAALRRQETPNG